MKKPAYNPADYPAVAVTVDVAMFCIRNEQLCLLLVERGEAPFKGAWALPGGFIKPNEDADTAARRELKEETGVSSPAHLEQLQTYSSPKRDPRMRVASIAYTALVSDIPKTLAGSDAADTRLWPIDDLNGRKAPKLAFDHDEIINDAIERIRSKLEYTSLATSLLEEPFTIAELRRVYEVVWGTPLHAANFRRKLLATKGFVVETKGTRKASGGGPAAALFKAGSAAALQPAMLRPNI